MSQQHVVVPIEEFGRDHWSTFGYIECRCVDHKGVPDRDHMRCNPEQHPGLVNRVDRWDPKYGTRLKGYGKAEGEAKQALQLEWHDDWHCAEDLEQAGLLITGGTGIHPLFSLTDVGQKVAAQLREHKARGGTFSNFEPDLLVFHVLEPKKPEGEGTYKLVRDQRRMVKLR